MATNTDNRGQGAQSHYTRQTSFLSATFLVGTALTGDGQQPSGNLLGPAAGTYDFQIGNLPSGARVCRAFYVTGTAIAGSTATVAVGNVQGGAQFVAAVTFGTAGFVSLTIVAAQTADYIVTPTPVWARFVVAGTLTALQSDLLVEYVITHGPQGQF